MGGDIILTYLFLVLSIVSIWVIDIKLFKAIPIWGVFLFFSLVFGMIGGVAEIKSFLYALFYGFLVYSFYQRKSIFSFFVVLLFTIPLFFHFLVIGFDNYKYVEGIVLSKKSVPYSLYLNLDKTLIGVFILGLGSEKNCINFFSYLKIFFYSFFLMVIVFFALTFFIRYSEIDPKMPAFILIWMLSNLFFTCISEELLFRGFIQKEVFLFFNNKKGIGLISVSIAAIFFGLAHYKGGVNYVVLSSIAGVFYGYIYYRSGTIKSSIFLHFLFNLTHILLFTYPALRD